MHGETLTAGKEFLEELRSCLLDGLAVIDKW
jgi:hypothetical protein